MKIACFICEKTFTKKEIFHVSCLDETMLLDTHECSQGYIFFSKRSRKKSTYYNCSASFPSFERGEKRRKVERLIML